MIVWLGIGEALTGLCDHQFKEPLEELLRTLITIDCLLDGRNLRSPNMARDVSTLFPILKPPIAHRRAIWSMPAGAELASLHGGYLPQLGQKLVFDR